MLVSACGKSSDTSWTRALPVGTYDLSSPTCGSTGVAPNYPTISYRVALFDFDALTEHTLSVEKLDVTETFKTATCTVTVKRGIFRNYDGVFATRHDRRYTFEPAGCTLEATVQTVTYKVGPEYSDLLKDGDDRSEELPFEVTTDDDHTYRLTSEDLADLNDLWGNYGCARPDRLKAQATLRPLLSADE